MKGSIRVDENKSELGQEEDDAVIILTARFCNGLIGSVYVR